MVHTLKKNNKKVRYSFTSTHRVQKKLNMVLWQCKMRTEEENLE